MSGIVGDIKKLFKFKYKTRSDTITDQYHRLFMTRALLAGAFLTGLNWFKDDIKCIVPKAFGGSVDGFGPKSCWINGFYVYKELMTAPNFDGYYGLPSTMGHNGTVRGTFSSSKGPVTCSAVEGDPECQPMEKLFFLQYQWFPFYMAFVALFYYFPYILFNFVNTDLVSFKKDINGSCDVDAIVKNYFNRKTNITSRQTMRVILNVVVKIFYILANVLVLSFTNSLLNDRFISFGSHWMSWSGLDNFKAHNYVGTRSTIKAGENLLPVFGFCDVLEQGKDIKHSLINEYSLVCEISQHVLYHYVLIAIWVLLVIGLVVSILGLLLLILEHFMRSHLFANEEVAAQQVYSKLSIREGEYLNFARKKNVVAYGSIVRALYKEMFDCKEMPPSPTSTSKF